MVNVPERLAPVSVATSIDTDPFPVPLLDPSVTQLSALDAIQEHAEPAVTEIDPPPPDDAKERPVGLMENVHAAGAIATVTGCWVVSAGTLLSETEMVTGNDPGVVGVPLITPVEELSESPDGKAPFVTDHVNGAIPPVAWQSPKNAVPTVPASSEQATELSEGRLPSWVIVIEGNAEEPTSTMSVVERGVPGFGDIA